MNLKNEDMINKIITKVENDIITFKEFVNYHAMFIYSITLHVNRKLIRKYAKTLLISNVECETYEEKAKTEAYKDALKSVLYLPESAYNDEDLVNIYKEIVENILPSDMKESKK